MKIRWIGIVFLAAAFGFYLNSVRVSASVLTPALPNSASGGPPGGGPNALQKNNGAGGFAGFAGSGPLSGNQFANQIGANGNLSGFRPTCSTLSDSQPSCSSDTTNATNITSGTLGAPEGGSGVSSPTAHSLLMGEGASPFNLLTAATAGDLIIDQGAGNDFLEKVLSGDCTITSAGAITCTKTNGVAFATSATTDTTNASNLSSGTLANARLPVITSANTDNSILAQAQSSTSAVNFGTGITGPVTLLASTPYTGIVVIASNNIQVTTGVGCSAGSNTSTITLAYTLPSGSAKTTVVGAATVSANGAAGGVTPQNSIIAVQTGTIITYSVASVLASTGCSTIPQYQIYFKVTY